MIAEYHHHIIHNHEHVWLISQHHNALKVDSGECLFEIGHFEECGKAHGDDIEADQLVVDLQDVVGSCLLVEEGWTHTLVDPKG